LDVALGGQGAPLVPIGDLHLFGQYDACLNLGGIANVSFQHQGQRIAYDIGPANMLLNPLAQRAGLPYDDNGQLARQGQLIPDLIQQLNELSYYTQPFPKSLGYEWFLEQVIPLLDNYNHTPADLLHTAVAHISAQISQDLKYYHPQGGRLLATGGGAKNGFLIQTLQQDLGQNWQVIAPSEELIDFKEALVFAFMSVRYLRNEVNCLSSVTGARRDCVGGRYFEPV
ncbi:MAG: anhydro-N-acetylmuramic acid kinase, partial [Bacteroidota bacterium]